MELEARRFTFPQQAKLKKSSDFLLVLKARGEGVVRASGQWIDVKVLLSSNGNAAAKIGLTVGKHLCKRSVDRNLIKRVFREASRHSSLCYPLIDDDLHIDRKLILRLKRKVPDFDDRNRLSVFKKELREEANRLLNQLEDKIRVLDQGNGDA